MNCVQPFELESSEDLGEIPSSVDIIEIEKESHDDEKLEKTKMSENLTDNSNFLLSEVNLSDKKQEFTDKIGQDCQEDSIDVENLFSNVEHLNSHRATENSNEFFNLYETNLADEKQEFSDKIEYDCQGDNEISIHYFCSMCPASFDKKSSLFQHFTVMHEKPKTKPSKLKPHGCKECKGTYKTKLSLKKHIKNVHQNLTRFSCGECKATFGLKYNMKKHVKIVHEKVKSFECQVCEATFGTKYNLQSHNKRIHQKSEPLGYQEFSLD